jgi:chromosome segregation ATPase
MESPKELLELVSKCDQLRLLADVICGNYSESLAKIKNLERHVKCSDISYSRLAEELNEAKNTIEDYDINKLNHYKERINSINYKIIVLEDKNKQSEERLTDLDNENALLAARNKKLEKIFKSIKNNLINK